MDLILRVNLETGPLIYKANPVPVIDGSGDIFADGTVCNHYQLQPDLPTDFVSYKSDGTVWAVGLLILFSLKVDLGTDNFTTVLILFKSWDMETPLSGVLLFSLGIQHSVFLKDDSTILGVGYNSYGPTGGRISKH